MNVSWFSKLIITNSFVLLFCTLCSYAADYDYPKSREEKEMERIGSFLGGEGLVIRPSKVRSDSTKTQNSHVNQYLFDAAVKVLSQVTKIDVQDVNSGVVMTMWYSANGEASKTELQLRALIKDNVISPEAIDVEIFRRQKNKKKEIEKISHSNALEAQIIREARSEYLKSKKQD